MPNDFKAEVFQNEYLSAGANEVHAIMTVTAGEGTAPTSQGRLFGILCDVSGSMEGGKIAAAKSAMSKLVDMLPTDCNFFIVTGSEETTVVASVAPANANNKAQALAAIRSISANGGTRISVWLQAALQQFRNMPGAVRHAL